MQGIKSCCTCSYIPVVHLSTGKSFTMCWACWIASQCPGTALGFGLSGRKGVAWGRLSSPSQLWPEEGRGKKEEKISRERMWLLVELMAESCELGMGKKAAGFSRKGSVTVEDGLLLIMCSELFLQEQWISVPQSFPICFQNSSFLPFLSPSALSTVIFISILPLCSPKFLWGWGLNEAIDKVTHINQQSKSWFIFIAPVYFLHTSNIFIKEFI